MKMRGHRIAACFALLCICVGASTPRELHEHSLRSAKVDPKASFQQWAEEFGKAYVEGIEDYEHRFAVWLDNLEYVIRHNEKGSSYWLGLNRWSDLTQSEFSSRSFGFRAELLKQSRARQNAVGSGPFRYHSTSPPKEVDWVKKGAVTRVKNQLQCGSCWAFSTTGSIEAANQIYTGNLTSLSEQQLVDCDLVMDHGCNGGLMDYAFEYVKDNGISTEENYKYLGVQGECDVSKRDNPFVSIDGHEDVPVNDEIALMKAVANQPVSVAIEADERDFQLYAGGVFDAPCGTALDHGVLIVGYGYDKDANGTVKPYWKVKNSWGQQWGDEGYIKLVRNLGTAGASPGQCGVAMVASYPVKTSPNPTPRPPAPPGPTPPPPAPKPVDCDEAGTTSCPVGSTCCCQSSFFDYCFAWACCPLPEATCCEDGAHCCPTDLPVCNTAEGRCTKKNGASWESQPWVPKQSAIRNTAGRSWVPRAPRIPTWVNDFLNSAASSKEQVADE